jgi:hypothetical protein
MAKMFAKLGAYLTSGAVLWSGLTVVAQQPVSPLEELYRKQRERLPSHDEVCFPVKKVVCTAGICNPSSLSVFYLIRPSLATRGEEQRAEMSRYDESGCDSYQMVSRLSGLFEIMQPREPNGMLFKTDGAEFVEVATSWLDAFISTGYCRQR